MSEVKWIGVGFIDIRFDKRPIEDIVWKLNERAFWFMNTSEEESKKMQWPSIEYYRPITQLSIENIPTIDANGVRGGVEEIWKAVIDFNLWLTDNII